MVSLGVVMVERSFILITGFHIHTFSDVVPHILKLLLTLSLMLTFFSLLFMLRRNLSYPILYLATILKLTYNVHLAGDFNSWNSMLNCYRNNTFCRNLQDFIRLWNNLPLINLSYQTNSSPYSCSIIGLSLNKNIHFCCSLMFGIILIQIISLLKFPSHFLLLFLLLPFPLASTGVHFISIFKTTLPCI